MSVAIYLGGNSDLPEQVWWYGQRMNKLLLLAMAVVLVGCEATLKDAEAKKNHDLLSTMKIGDPQICNRKSSCTVSGRKVGWLRQ